MRSDTATQRMPTQSADSQARQTTRRSLSPAGMVLVPGGEFDRGDSSGAGYRDEQPVRRIRVSAFHIDRTEVTWALWNQVSTWAQTNGYQFDDNYDFHPDKPDSHPVCNVSWHDAVKWANARSEQEGRTPAYLTNSAPTDVYRSGTCELTADRVRWETNGYRLPTETEWEWAARGGLEHQHYPWPSPGTNFSIHLDGGRANFWQSGDPWESDAECATTPAGYFNGSQQPAGHNQTNGFGLYDMAGNVAEWCWDWYHDRWYEEAASGLPDTRGPTWGYGRVLRGGSWISSDKYCRVSARYMSAPDYRCHCYGLRLVVTAGAPPPRAVDTAR